VARRRTDIETEVSGEGGVLVQVEANVEEAALAELLAMIYTCT